MSAKQTYDTIIVGAGHNGLVAANYLAKAGRKALVLERRDRAGGQLELHAGGQLRPDIVRDLDLAKHGLSAGTAAPYVSLLPDGRRLVLSLSDEVPAHTADRFAAEAAADEGTGALAVWPSPVRGGESMKLAFNLAGRVTAPADLDISVYDIAGRRVTRMPEGTFANGMVTTEWNGRDDQQRAVSAGIYFVRVTSPSAGISRERRIVMK